MRDESPRSIYHKILLVLLVIYGIRSIWYVSTNKDGLLDKLKKAVGHSKRISWMFFLTCLCLLGMDYKFNDKLTEYERQQIYLIIHTAIVVTMTALFAHLDLFVMPGMLAITLWYLNF